MLLIHLITYGKRTIRKSHDAWVEPGEGVITRAQETEKSTSSRESLGKGHMRKI